MNAVGRSQRESWANLDSLLHSSPRSPSLFSPIYDAVACSHEEMPFLVCHVSLITESGQSADLLSPASSPTRAEEQTSASGSTSEVSGSSSRRGGSSRRRGAATSLSPVQPPRGAESLQSAGPLRMLYGTLVASPQHFQDIEGQMRTFFLYPEISVRAVGRFQIRVVLMRIPRWVFLLLRR